MGAAAVESETTYAELALDDRSPWPALDTEGFSRVRGGADGEPTLDIPACADHPQGLPM